MAKLRGPVGKDSANAPANPEGGGDRRRDRRSGPPQRESRSKLYAEDVVKINRCAKVVKGGKRFSFAAFVVLGDGKTKVGFGMGKAKEVALSIDKAVRAGEKNVRPFPIVEGTIPHAVDGRYGAAKVRLMPAAPGTGVIAGGAARAILEEAGVHDVLCKSLGSSNHINVARATIAGLKGLKRPDEVARLRGLDAGAFAPKGMLAAYNESERGPQPAPEEVA